MVSKLGLTLQEAYIRGVSGWNFDVAALKRNANEEGPGLERLSTIAETPGQLSCLTRLALLLACRQSPHCRCSVVARY